jgi:hypothetical protein
LIKLISTISILSSNTLNISIVHWAFCMTILVDTRGEPAMLIMVLYHAQCPPISLSLLACSTLDNHKPQHSLPKVSRWISTPQPPSSLLLLLLPYAINDMGTCPNALDLHPYASNLVSKTSLVT